MCFSFLSPPVLVSLKTKSTAPSTVSVRVTSLLLVLSQSAAEMQNTGNLESVTLKSFATEIKEGVLFYNYIFYTIYLDVNAHLHILLPEHSSCFFFHFLLK